MSHSWLYDLLNKDIAPLFLHWRGFLGDAKYLDEKSVYLTFETIRGNFTVLHAFCVFSVYSFALVSKLNFELVV